MSPARSLIYHIVVAADFRAQTSADLYRPTDLSQVGFVHCALEASVLQVADDYYGQSLGDVLVLEIDPEKLSAATRYEAAAPIAGGGTSHLVGAPEFPHVYGPIETHAITRVGVLDKSAEGFRWPASFTNVDSFLAST